MSALPRMAQMDVLDAWNRGYREGWGNGVMDGACGALIFAVILLAVVLL